MQQSYGKESRRNRALEIGVFFPLLVLGLAACSPADTAILVGVSTISYLATDKTVPDHIVSQVLNKDCSSTRLINDGKLCAEETVATTVASAIPTYCYRTLGSVSCYASRDPYDPRSVEIAWPSPNGSGGASPQKPAPSLALRDGENKGN